MSRKTLYIFLDESGNLDFGSKGSRYFLLSCVTMIRPFVLHTSLDTYKYDLIEYGLGIEFFHCAYDNKHVRSRVFDLISKRVHGFEIHSLIVEKGDMNLVIRDETVFYPTMLGSLLQHVTTSQVVSELDEVVIITDGIPMNRKKKAVEKAIRSVLVKMLPDDMAYRVFHHMSRSHYGLQIADYCNWALFRKWEHKDCQYYDMIRPALFSEIKLPSLQRSVI